jgi:F-type H+-transporting ATPase subunit b
MARKAALSLTLVLALGALALGSITPAQISFAPSMAAAQEGAEEAKEEVEGNEHEHAHGLRGMFQNTSFLAALVNFSLLVYLLRRLGKKPLSDFLVNRRKLMERDMAAAAEMKAKAEAVYREFEQRLAQLDQDLVKLRSDIERGAQEDKQRIVAEAEDTTRRLKQETESLIDQYSKALSADVRREMVDAAVGAAEKILRDNMSDTDQQRLATRFDEDLKHDVKARTAPRTQS